MSVYVTVMLVCVTVLTVCVTVLSVCVIVLSVCVTVLPVCVTVLTACVTVFRYVRLLPVCATVLPICLTVLTVCVILPIFMCDISCICNYSMCDIANVFDMGRLRYCIDLCVLGLCDFQLEMYFSCVGK